MVKSITTMTRRWWLPAFALLLTSPQLYGAKAAEAEEPMATMKTAISEMGVEGQVFTVYLNSMQTQTVYVDAGAGKVPYEVTNTVDGTPITIEPSSTEVKFYGDPTKIDYIYCRGGYLTSADVSRMVNLDVLDLSHNELEYLDLSSNVNLRMIDLDDNRFATHPLVIGPKPGLLSLSINHAQTLDPAFSIASYPDLKIFSAWNVPAIKELDPSCCPALVQLSVGDTSLSSLDVTNNPELRILSINNTFIREIDLSQNPLLTEFYASRDGSYAELYGLKSLDVSNNPNLVYLFLGGNHLKELDLSNNPNLVTLHMRRNDLTSINLEDKDNLNDVDISYNNMCIATIPADQGQWYEYYYNQNPMVVNRTYGVGQTIDLSDKVLRDDWPVYMALLSVSRNNPSEPVEVDADKYSYANGKITFNEALPDSVYAEFYTPMLPACAFATTSFKVRSAEDFGKPVKTIYFSPDPKNAGKTLTFGFGVVGSSEENPSKFWVDFGDGELKEFTSSSPTGTRDNVSGVYEFGQVAIYVAQDEEPASLYISDIPLGSCRVEDAPTLVELELINTRLYSLDLDWNRNLTSLCLNGNTLGYFSVLAPNTAYEKRSLRHLNLSNNSIQDLSYDPGTLITLDLSKNNLTEVDLSKAYFITDLNVSANELTYLNLQALDAIKRLDVSSNQLSSLVLPDLGQPESVNIILNNFTLASMPYLPEELDEFIYAPQQPIQILTKGPGCNLNSQNLVINGNQTEFKWYDVNGTELKEGEDYVLTQGRTRFLNYDAGKVYCEISNATYPEFRGRKALRTTDVLVAEPPTNLLAEMDVRGYGNEMPELSLASDKKASEIFIDWAGDGKDYDEYLLTDTYRLFYPEIQIGGTAKVYTYEDYPNLTVFSVTAIKLGKADFSRLSELITLGLYDCEATQVILPEETQKLEELKLLNGDYDYIDVEPYSNLRSLLMQYCGLNGFDLSPLKKLQWAHLPNNYISKVVIDNPELISLDLTYNELEELDLSNAPNLYQFFVPFNLLTHIDVDHLTKLTSFDLSFNAFGISTLPLPKPQYGKYIYNNQAVIEPDIDQENSTVDLSDQLYAGDTETVYAWYLGVPGMDEYGEIVGDLLVEGEDYTISNGVTTFPNGIEQAVCVMTNEEFPNLYLLTWPIDVEGSGVEDVVASMAVKIAGRTVTATVPEATEGALYTLDGICVDKAVSADGCLVLTAPDAGIYVARIGGRSLKVNLK